MSIRSFFIRIAASCIWLMRRRTLRAGDVRLLVFTGTSGKTLARSATAFALGAAGQSVVSPPYGYTNELGVVLAALGTGTTRLFSTEGIRSVLHSSPQPGAYICVEAGADWRADIPWLIKRFRPHGIFITNVSDEEWTRPLERIWADKQDLVDSIRPGGFLAYNAQNESVEHIRSLGIPSDCQKFEFSVRLGEKAIEYQSPFGVRSFLSPDADVEPHAQALGSAVAALELTGNRATLREDFFQRYVSPTDRFARRVLSGGALLVSDTYKAVPQCTKYVLGFALSMGAQRRVAVVSAMHPLWFHTARHYERIGADLARFDAAYFIGPRTAFVQVTAHAPQVIYAGDWSITELARLLRESDEPGTVIVIKTAGRYRMDRLVELLS